MQGGENVGKKFTEMTPEELIEAGRKGGKASVKARRERRERTKDMRHIFTDLLTMTISNGKVYSTEEIDTFSKLKGKNITVNEAICVKQVQLALMGNQKAFEFIRDIMGDKPAERFEIKDVTPVIIAGENEIKD